MVIDSSKHASLAFCLRSSPDVDLRVVHMVRDSRAVAYSWSKVVERPEAAGSQMSTYPAASAALRWDLQNSALQMLSQLGTPTLRVRYEDFVRSPAATLSEIAAFAGLPGGPDFGFLGTDGPGRWWADLRATHTASGNPMRFTTGRVPIRYDAAWQAAMLAGNRRTVTALTLPLLMRYGYLGSCMSRAALTGWRVAGVSAIALVVVAAVVVTLTVGLGWGKPKPRATPEPALPRTPLAIPAPATGAYFGAWVDPAMYGQHGHVGAVNALQLQIGRRLDIVHTYLRQPAPFPTSSDLAWVRQGSMLLVSWALNDSRGIAAGEWDAAIRQRARELKALGKPVFLEWRWEMDRPNLRFAVGTPADYIAAWKHIRLIFAEQHVTNVAWVWCPTARGFASGTAQAYYPGNSEVDWVCADAYPRPGTRASFSAIIQPFLSLGGPASETNHDRRVRGAAELWRAAPRAMAARRRADRSA